MSLWKEKNERNRKSLKIYNIFNINNLSIILHKGTEKQIHQLLFMIYEKKYIYQRKLT